MAILSGTRLVQFIATFNIALAYIFLTAPQKFADHDMVFILGAAMGLPPSPSLTTPSTASSFTATLLLLLGLTDLTASSMREEISSIYWSSQAPLRFLFFALLTAYSFLGKASIIDKNLKNLRFVTGGDGEGLHNSALFTWGFLNTLGWFWVYNVQREERREFLGRVQRRREAEEERERYG
ncbi:MAG: hypothetical protein MMC33_000404 [Icmadophila ericetorum]|nr:hypothetical protein [Icmadophila ericetorum]